MAAVEEETQARAIQAVVEGVVLSDKVTLCGRQFRIADKVGLMPLMRFAHAASSGLDTGDMEALAAMYDMLADCIHPEDWPAFEAHATASKADADDLFPVVQQTVEALAARPTKSRSGSSESTGPAPTPTSTGSSSETEAAEYVA